MFSSPRSIIAFIILVLALIIFWLSDRLEKKAGLPTIGINIVQQLGNLASNSPSLKGISMGSRTFTRALGEPPSIKGYFIYDAQQNGSSFDLRVYWATDSTNCWITKVEKRTTFAEPQVIWAKP